MLGGWLVGWVGGWVGGWLVGWVVGWVVGWLASNGCFGSMASNVDSKTELHTILEKPKDLVDCELVNASALLCSSSEPCRSCVQYACCDSPWFMIQALNDVVECAGYMM